MYSQHLGLSQEPFSIAPDPRFMFMSERHREALAHLLYGVSGGGGLTGSGGFVLLTGEIGTGKTTVCRCFLEQVPAHSHVAYIFNPKLSVIELLQSICQEFHLEPNTAGKAQPSAKDCIDALNKFLLQSHGAGQSCVLIIDEAQNLEPDVLEQLRLLTNLETNERKLLQIVLIGQPELRTMLARPDLEQLAQRVIARFHLQALGAGETQHYIAHRLSVAGHQGRVLFEPAALRRIHELSQGVPRRINLLCDRALLGAWANGLQTVSKNVIDKAASEVFAPEPSATQRSRRVLTLMAILAVLLLAYGSWWAWQTWQSNRPAVKAISPAQPSEAPSSPTPAAPPVPEVKPAATVDSRSLLAAASSDINGSWQALGPIWKLSLEAAAPCESATLAPWQCYRANRLSLVQLRQLDRPGIISLQEGSSPAVYALLVGLNTHSALLEIKGQRYRIGQLALAQLWRGDFATLWKVPEGYRPDLADGASGPAVDALAQGLAQLEGRSGDGQPITGAKLDASLRERVRNFQRTLGLVPDGQPGPLTFMQLARATEADRPRLLSDWN